MTRRLAAIVGERIAVLQYKHGGFDGHLPVGIIMAGHPRLGRGRLADARRVTLRRPPGIPALMDDRGLATLEVALITPVLILVLLAFVQFGLWYHAEQVTIAAAQEAAAAASVQSVTPAAGQARAAQLLAGLATITSHTQINVGSDTSGITVSITSKLRGLIPGVVRLPLHAKATSHSEQAP